MNAIRDAERLPGDGLVSLRWRDGSGTTYTARLALGTSGIEVELTQGRQPWRQAFVCVLPRHIAGLLASDLMELTGQPDARSRTK